MTPTAPRRRLARAVASVTALALAAAACGDDPPPSPATQVTAAPATAAVEGAPAAPSGFAYGTGECPPAAVTDPVRQFATAPQLCIDPARHYTAEFVTTEGTIVVVLDTTNTPGTVNNFVTLARYRYYDDTPIFRAEPASGLWQAGGENNGTSPGYTIPDEGSGYQYPPGALAMANTGAADSAGAQFFFVTNERGAYLSNFGTYVVFGEITEGLDVADAITNLGDDSGVPTTELRIETVTISEN